LDFWHTFGVVGVLGFVSGIYMEPLCGDFQEIHSDDAGLLRKVDEFYLR
jgi:hypothetical protein